MTDIKQTLKKKMTKIFTKNEDFGEFKDENTIEKDRILNIPCDLIRPNRSQPRADFDDNELLRLAESIKQYGIIQPLVLRKADIDDIYDYELIAGERRLRAARILELYSVPGIVVDVDDRISAELAIVENMMRSDLNMFETAYALKNLGEDYDLTQEEIARKMSMSQSAVANKIRLLKLSYEEQQLVLSCSLTERHARALLRLPEKQMRIKAIHHIFDFGMNVKDSEAYIEKLLECKNENGENEKTEKDNGIFEARICELDKGAAAVIRNIHKKLESFEKSGRQTSLELEDSGEDIELHIRIKKS